MPVHVWRAGDGGGVGGESSHKRRAARQAQAVGSLEGQKSRAVRMATAMGHPEADRFEVQSGKVSFSPGAFTSAPIVAELCRTLPNFTEFCRTLANSSAERYCTLPNFVELP